MKGKDPKHLMSAGGWNKGLKMPNQSGENHFRWILDRTKLAKQEERNGNRHKEWSKTVKNRDSWRCKINNQDCFGKVIAHHILPWAKFPELRYEVNNGITLCKFHHPRRRAEEVASIPVFQGLVATSVN